MNEGRFDELAKGLATNRFSRGQVLKGFAAALLGSVAGGLLGGTREAEAKKKKRVLRCPSCGTCTQLDTFSDGRPGTAGDCQDSCVAKTLCAQANKDASVKKLANYLKNEGFTLSAEPQAFVLQQDGTPIGSVLEASYTSSSDSDQTATLSFVQDKVGGQKNEALAYLYENEELAHVLVVGVNSSLVHKEPVPDTQGTASLSLANSGDESASDTATSNSTADTGVTAAGSSTCSSICSEVCKQSVGTVCKPAGTYICAGFAEAGPGAVAACVAAVKFICKQGAKTGCSDLCEGACQCSPLVACAGATGFRGCCASCQDCPNGECINTCPSENELGQATACCTSSAGSICATLCPFGQHWDDNTCNCVCDEGDCGPERCCRGKCCPPGETCVKGECKKPPCKPRGAGCSSGDECCSKACFGGCINCQSNADCDTVSARECCQGTCYGPCPEGQIRDPHSCKCVSDNQCAAAEDGCGCSGGCPRDTHCCNGTCVADTSTLKCGAECKDCRNTPQGPAVRAICDNGMCRSFLADGTIVVF